jgi:serine/threonine-protein kinase
MDEDQIIRTLVEEILESNRTPEEVCAKNPALLPAVRKRLREYRLLCAQLDELFPEENATSTKGYHAGNIDPPNIEGYEFQGMLGRGGMGVVFKALHLKLNRIVALKMMRAGEYARPAELVRFQLEAEAIAALRHPNIVQIYDVGEAAGQPYFTMEFLEGGSLAQKLSGTPQPAPQAADLIAILAETIHVAHERGIVHRDLKPANVLLTADGVPKISDFGLAHVAKEGALTLTGVPLGTPNYMAPELIRGDRASLGPATDVYALGVILYEMLTGGPPFRAENAAATTQLALNSEPIAPSRFNPGIPRDLETICLKCLSREPHRRYSSAAELAADLRRFERGEAITARPVSLLSRLARRARRRPMAAAFIVTLPIAALLGLALVASWLWVSQQRAAIERAIEDDLREVSELEEKSDWRRAWIVLDRAKGKLGKRELSDFRQRMLQIEADLNLAMQLEDIRLNRTPLVDGQFSKLAAARDYAAAFAKAKLAQDQDDPSEVAARVKASPVDRALIAALDDWALCTPDANKQKWCLDVARAADPDPDDWRDRVRDAAVWKDKSALANLANAALVAAEPIQLLVAVGEQLLSLGVDPSEFLKRVQAEHPSDFWANFRLGNALVRQNPGQAIGYFRAALAVRPDAVVVWNNLAVALKAAGQLDEAIACYERTVRNFPAYAPAHNNLGLALKAKGKHDEAFVSFQRALTIDPQFAPAHSNLGNAYRGRGDIEKAIEHYEQAIRCGPPSFEPHFNLALLAEDQKRVGEAMSHYEKAVELNPRLAAAHNNLANILLDLGRVDEAISHCQQAAAIKPDSELYKKNLARALMVKAARDEKKRD